MLTVKKDDFDENVDDIMNSINKLLNGDEEEKEENVNNSKIIIIEGAQGTGKSTITDYLRYSIPYTNLYRLSGINDVSKNGKEKVTKMYDALINYIKNLEGAGINLLFDRLFFSEEVYCRLGLKDYNFDDEYEKLLSELANMDFDIYYITLYLGDTEVYAKRLDRPGKANYNNSPFNKENSVKQQSEYLKISDEIKQNYPNIHILNVDTNKEVQKTEEEILEFLNK